MLKIATVIPSFVQHKKTPPKQFKFMTT